MRDPARIDRILGTLREVWHRHPDQRLGQLIVNAIRPSRPCPQVFFPEDDAVERGLPLAADRPTYTENEVSLALTRAEALVLFDLLSGYAVGSGRLELTDQAEETVLNGLLCLLEAQLHEPFDREYPHLLDQARTALRAPADSPLGRGWRPQPPTK